MLDSLPGLARRLQAVPAAVVAAAVAANPWFTPHYIEESLRALRPWLDPQTVRDFLEAYPDRDGPPKPISIVAAGNLPLVGFHDVLMTLLARHRAVVKYSHQDRVLMDWVRDCWLAEAPFLADFFHPVSQVKDPDYLIATGSNHTARHLRQLYQGIPVLIRHNRFSVALLTADMSEQACDGLWRDVLLYNGLGCRNVSNLLLLPGASLDPWLSRQSAYPTEWINPHYLERVLLQRARIRTLKKPGIETAWVMLSPAATFQYASMGMVYWVQVQGEAEAQVLLSAHQEHIQCVVGRDMPYGQTQMPALADFADGVDTMAWLCKI
ncbi:MAG: hypothetical protein D6722_15325 [Bacteroidetes bacterium]|nr:MAG: hypothetical protein D6722_15325 [Bacteroidota bacterium]